MHGSLPEVGQKQKTEGKKKTKKMKVGDNNGQATQYAWRMQASMAHASRLGQHLRGFLLYVNRYEYFNGFSYVSHANLFQHR